MKFNKQHLVLPAALVAVLAVALAYRMMPEENSSSAPVDLEAEVAVVATELQSNPAQSKLRSLVEDPQVPEILVRASTEDGGLRKEEAKQGKGGVCIRVTDTGKHLGEEQGLVSVTRVEPETPTWSTEVMLVKNIAQLGEIPEGRYNVVVSSSSFEWKLTQSFTWPNPNGEQNNQLEFDLDAAVKKASEGRAMATLRMITGAQQQVQASAAIDCDGDGGGQYAFLAELAGTSPMRVYGVAGSMRGGPQDHMNPPFLASKFGVMQAGPYFGCVRVGGYYYRVHLPAMTPTADEPVAAIFEAPDGGVGLDPADPAMGELLWGAYAWPADSNTPGRATFFINQEGDVSKRSGDHQAPYEGLNSGPAFDAALSSESPRDMRARLSFAAMGTTANDGGIWTQPAH
ncbi:MAG: hypothetical protein JKY61_08670 [Planctomycetes bacterium]|nr:hypothetical protein [Planctomycetota bacterium]